MCAGAGSSGSAGTTTGGSSGSATRSPISSRAPSSWSARRYPAILVRTALNDSQVMYWEPAKWVAKLRTLKLDDRPLLLKVNLEAGHGGASGRYDALRELGFDYAFILGRVGRGS